MDYLDILSNLGHSWWGILAIFVLLLMRLGPIFALVPFLGKGVAPIMSRVALMLCLGVVFLPFVAFHIKEPVSFNNAFIQYSLKELAIGFVLGFFYLYSFSNGTNQWYYHRLPKGGLYYAFARPYDEKSKFSHWDFLQLHVNSCFFSNQWSLYFFSTL